MLRKRTAQPREKEQLNQEEKNSSTKTDNLFHFSSYFSSSLTILTVVL